MFKSSVIQNICIDWYIGNIHATEQIDSKKVIFTIRSAKFLSGYNMQFFTEIKPYILVV